jgi:integrase
MFILHNPKSDAPTYIYLKKAVSDGQVKASLSMKLLPALWDAKTKRAIVTGIDRNTLEENKSINSVLSDIEKFIEARTRDARYGGKRLIKSDLLAKIEEVTGRRIESRQGAGFFDHCENILEDMRSGRLLTPRTQKRYARGTIAGYKNAVGKVKEFKPDIQFNQVDQAFGKAFVKWCNDKDFSMNYIWNLVKNIVQLVDEAHERGIHTSTDYNSIQVAREDTEDIHLEPQELNRIYRHNLPNKALDLARDWFIIDCYLGLRVSDIKMLEQRNFTGDFVTIVNEKTDTKVVVPLRPEIKAILKKWKGLPPKITDVEINRCIKKVAELAGIKGTVLYYLTKGGERKDYYLHKYEMVSCHTARRSFITNLLEAGIPDNQVMHLAGIKKHHTLLRYKKTKPEKTADIVKSHSFFSPHP